MRQSKIKTTRLNRRALLRNGSLILLGTGLNLPEASALFADAARRKARLGLITDMHYADKAPAGSRHYRETLAK
ncbi:MAG: alkaline phosphatase, partial [Planctomycetales bacterium]